MTAPSKTFNAPSDAQIDPDSPVDTTLMTQLRDALVHLEEWLGKDYTAATNHNHDGVNSASLDVGTDNLRNGSFETNSTTGWTTTAYTGGTIATGTAGAMDGTYALAITSTNVTNGGGDVLSSGLINCSGGANKQFRFMFKASTANVSSAAYAVWYNAAEAQISETELMLTSATPTGQLLCVRRVDAPALARFCRIKLVGGVPTVGAAVGTVYFDGVSIEQPALMGRLDEYIADSVNSPNITGDVVAYVRGAEGDPGVYAEAWAALVLSPTDTIEVHNGLTRSVVGSLYANASSGATPSSVGGETSTPNTIRMQGITAGVGGAAIYY